MTIIIFFNNSVPEVNKRWICFLYCGVEKVSSYYSSQVLDYVAWNLHHSSPSASHKASNSKIASSHYYCSHCKYNDSRDNHRELVFPVQEQL